MLLGIHQTSSLPAIPLSPGNWLVATTPHVVAGLDNGTTYYFVVTATRDAGQSDASGRRRFRRRPT